MLCGDISPIGYYVCTMRCLSVVDHLEISLVIFQKLLSLHILGILTCIRGGGLTIRPVIGRIHRSIYIVFMSLMYAYIMYELDRLPILNVRYVTLEMGEHKMTICTLPTAKQQVLRQHYYVVAEKQHAENVLRRQIGVEIAKHFHNNLLSSFICKCL